MIKKGTKSICKACNQEIEFTGKYWEHTTYHPRHPAFPTDMFLKDNGGNYTEEKETKTDLERFIELFNSVGIKYELDQTAENLDYICLIAEYGSKIFLFSKTGNFSYEDFWPYS